MWHTCMVCGRPNQGVGGGVHRLQLNGWGDCVVGTHLQHLLSSHQHTVVLLHRVEKDFDVAHPSFLPLVQVAIPAVQFGALLKQDLLVLLTRLDFNLKRTNVV